MDAYQSQYADLRFERSGLFRAIEARYRPREVLYPGCSIHITPSLYFPHVVYVDKSEAAARFFADTASLVEYINRHKYYRRRAYIRFIYQDYSRPLPLRAGAFDLVLALFAGGISAWCKNYLKQGGLLVSNNHQNDAARALEDPDLELLSILRFKSGQYVVTGDGIEVLRISGHRPYRNALRQSGGTVEYVDQETYYVFRRKSEGQVRPGGAGI